MPLLPTIGRTVGTGIKAIRLLVRGSVRSGAWATRRVGSARARGAANETGMVRLFDLHALSCAGDTLIAIGLAGTIFFNVPLDEARSTVALYLLVTMVPFALLAPVIGPLLDHFRHGRRYALAVTMLGRAFLVWLISDHLHGLGLYPAVFGVLVLSRAYGVARSAAVPRLLPEGVGLSQVGARASVYGTFAGAVVAPIGLAAFWFGPQWPLRVSSVIFLIGMVVALRLPPRADSEPPEAVPRPFRAMLRLGRGTDRPLSGRLVVATLIGSASLRFLYGFLLLYFAFAIKAGQLNTTVFGRDIGNQAAVGAIGGALAIGTFLATAIGTRLRIRRPLALQSSGLTITAGVSVLATIFFTLPMVALLAFVTAIFSGISKLAVDASIQERVPERLRASAFGHSETVLMIAWVLGGAAGIIPLTGRVGVAVAAAFAVAAAIRAAIVAARLHNERLMGRPDETPEDAAATPAGAPAGRTSGSPSSGTPSSRGPSTGGPSTGGPASSGVAATQPASTARSGSEPAAPSWPASAPPAGPADPWPDAPIVPPRRPAAPPAARPQPAAPAPRAGERPALPASLDQTIEPPPVKRRLPWRRRSKTATQETSQAATQQASKAAAHGMPPAAAQETSKATAEHGMPMAAPEGAAAGPGPDHSLAPPGYHIYRPSSATKGSRNGSTDGRANGTGSRPNPGDQ
jgi:MFS family permease